MSLLTQSLKSCNVSGAYVEDVFSTYLYAGNGIGQKIDTGVQNLSNQQAFNWYKFSKSNQHCYIDEIRTASSGNIYILGSIFSSGKYLIKLNSTFSIQWQKKLTSSVDTSNSLDIDGSENIYITGYGNDGTDYYAHIYKYDTTGSLQWQRSLKQNSSASTYGKSVFFNYQFNIISVAGSLYDGTNICGFLSSYTSNGAIQWQRKLQQSSLFQINNTQIVYSGLTYIVGKDGNSRGVIAQYNASGTIQWQRVLYEGSSSLIDNYVYDTTGCFVLGNGYNSTNGTYLCLAKYDSTGTIQWQQKIICPTKDFYSDAKFAKYISGSTNLYVVCQYSSNKKLFVAKFDTSGGLVWQRTVYHKNNISISGKIALDSSLTKLYIAGYYQDGTYNTGYLISLNEDGSTLNNNQSDLIIEPGVCSVLTGTMTDSAGSFTDSAGAATDAAATATDAVESVSISTNSISASTGKGGLVWIKDRSVGTRGHILFDTDATTGSYFLTTSGISSGLVPATSGKTNGAGSTNINFTPTGFTLGTDTAYSVNNYFTTDNYVSWTFRKQPKFFDMVTYTGDATSNKSITHNLGSVPGCIIIKRTDSTGRWIVYHQSVGSNGYLVLNTTAASTSSSSMWNATAPTSTQFTVGDIGDSNVSGATYVAYLFAHNAGGFGLSGTDNVISCGSFTTDASGNATVDLGWEPQWILTKQTNAAENWYLLDTMRGLYVDAGSGIDAGLSPNLSSAEANHPFFNPTATGFTLLPGSWLATSSTFIYIAIRRPNKPPTSGTQVFAPVAFNSPAGTNVTTGFPIDWGIFRYRPGTQTAYSQTRLLGLNSFLQLASTASESSSNPGFIQDWGNTGFTVAAGYANVNDVVWSFRRAPGFFDVVCYTGTGAGSGSFALNHNLGVVPELIIFRTRDTTSNWQAGTNFTSTGWRSMFLNNTNAGASQTTYASNDWFAAQPTATTFTVGWPYYTSNTYVAYLFASCPGISKIGSYTGNGSSQTINCGFTGGARFILIKRTDSTGDWYIWDTARGIVAANDPHLSLNITTAEVTTDDSIDPDSTGFIVNQVAATNINVTSATYIYLAIA